MVSARPVSEIFVATPQSEGVGARVRRSIGSDKMRSLDPFLLLDEFTVRKPAGFPEYVVPKYALRFLLSNIFTDNLPHSLSACIT